MSKDISKFIDFDTKFLGSTKKTDEFGISNKPAKKLSVHSYIVCPLCAMNRPLHRTGSWARSRAKKLLKGKTATKAHTEWQRKFKTKENMSERRRKYNPEAQTRFDLVDVKTAPFISIREARGKGGRGTGAGFQEVAIVTLKNIANLPDEDLKQIMPLISQLKKQCENILEEISGIT